MHGSEFSISPRPYTESLSWRFGGRRTEKHEKRRENMKNAQSQHRRHLAIAKSHVWRRQVRLKYRLGLILSVWRRQVSSLAIARWRLPPPSVLDMSFEVRYTRGTRVSTRGADTLRKSISDHLSLYCRYHVDALVYDNLTVPSGRYDTWTFLHYITHDQVESDKAKALFTAFCVNLVKGHPSFGMLKKLVVLNMS
ncbi:hypothetical protein OSB04_028492 [Centaurea solstitialis]|uniref:Uncharacterized protein n=1 Tax=Centaurea solstitialis TaxID=347529 RepID=A0AA38WB82_9ASTR|nr:hypothetical protein OSB04_028492 [Centaurea solstitialis]